MFHTVHYKKRRKISFVVTKQRIHVSILIYYHMEPNQSQNVDHFKAELKQAKI